MERFNRSVIGLIEQCNDGEWVKWADYVSLQYTLKEVRDHCSNLSKKNSSLIVDLDDMTTTSLKTLMRLNSLKKEHRFIKGVLALNIFIGIIHIVIGICSFIAG